jgi:hypothetical protein
MLAILSTDVRKWNLFDKQNCTPGLNCVGRSLGARECAPRAARQDGLGGFPGGASQPDRLLFECRFEMPPGKQAQVDFAFFRTVFTNQPGAGQIVWLFLLVPGHSRMMWGRFVAHQVLETVLR